MAKDQTWIGILIVAFVIIGDLLNRQIFGLIWLGLGVAFFLFLCIFHFLDKNEKLR